MTAQRRDCLGIFCILIFVYTKLLKTQLFAFFSTSPETEQILYQMMLYYMRMRVRSIFFSKADNVTDFPRDHNKKRSDARENKNFQFHGHQSYFRKKFKMLLVVVVSHL